LRRPFRGITHEKSTKKGERKEMWRRGEKKRKMKEKRRFEPTTRRV